MTSPKGTVIIIGAGLAGLAAALDLHRNGWETTVLEARERIGGRVYTIRDGFRDGQYAEGGGEFIEDFHTRMIALTKEFNLELDPVSGMESWQHWLAFDGKVGAANDVALWGADISKEIAKLWDAMSMLGQRAPNPERPQDSPEAAALDSQSVADWLAGLEAHPVAKKFFIARLRSEYTIEPEQYSLLDLARWGAFYYAQPDGEHDAFRIRGGNDQLAVKMAQALPALRLNTPVTALKWNNEYVEVCTRAPSSSQEEWLRAEAAVIAIPFKPLRRVSFDPGLPTQHAALINGLTYGAVTKVLIQYGVRLATLGWSGSVLTDLPITCTWHPTGLQPGACDIVTVYTGAQAGADFSALPDEERIELTIAQVEQVCPGSAQHVVAARTIAWGNEPYSQGSYAAFGPGEVTAHWETLRTPAGRLYFAGEHTAINQGYMEGAVESGQRVAVEIDRMKR